MSNIPPGSPPPPPPGGGGFPPPGGGGFPPPGPPPGGNFPPPGQPPGGSFPPPGGGSYPPPGGSQGFGGPQGFGAPQGQLAEWPQRAVAYLIEIGLGIAIYVVGFILALILGAIADGLGILMLLVTYLAAIAWSFYNGYLNGSTGQSVGKRLTGLRVVGEMTGQPIGGGMGIVRYLAHFIDSIICYIGWFLPLFDDKKQTIADKLLKTVVVTGAPKQAFGPDLLKP